MTELFKELPEALENNINIPYRCNYRPLPSKPLLPNISEDEKNSDKILLTESFKFLTKESSIFIFDA